VSEIAPLTEVGGIDKVALPVHQERHDDVIENAQRGIQGGQGPLRPGIHQERPGLDPEPPQQCGEQNRLVLAIAKAAPQHGAGSIRQKTRAVPEIDISGSERRLAQADRLSHRSRQITIDPQLNRGGLDLIG